MEYSVIWQVGVASLLAAYPYTFLIPGPRCIDWTGALETVNASENWIHDRIAFSYFSKEWMMIRYLKRLT